MWDWLAGGDDLYEGEVAAYATARATPVALFCADCQTTCEGGALAVLPRRERRL